VTRYALWGPVSRDILTYQGRPLVHHDRAELEYLFPRSRVVPMTDADLAARSPLPPMPVKDHPDMSVVAWPLDRKDFR
jgi:hypothetical protein